MAAEETLRLRIIGDEHDAVSSLNKTSSSIKKMASDATRSGATVKRDQAAQVTALRKTGTSYTDLARKMGTTDAEAKKVGADSRRTGAAMTGMGSQAKKAAVSTAALSSAQKSLGGTMRSGIKSALALGAAYVGLSQIKSAVTATDNLASATGALTHNLGFATKTASAFAAVASSRGLDSASLTMGFKSFSKQVEAAKAGTESATKAFTDLGISQKELKKNSPQRTLFEITDGLGKMGVGTQRVTTGSLLFGRAWAKLSPILRDGSKNLKEQMAMAEKYGASFTGTGQKAGQKAQEDFIAKQREMKLATLGLQVSFTQNLLPALVGIAGGFLKATVAFRKASPQIKLITVGVGLMALAFTAPLAAIAGLGIALVILYHKSKPFHDIVDKISKVVKEKAVVAFGALKSAGATVVQFLKDAVSWFKRAYSNVKGFLGALIPVKIALAVLGVAFGVLKVLMGPVIAIIKALAKVFKTVLVGAIKVVWQQIKLVGNVIGNVVGIVSNLLRGDFSGAWKNAKQLVTGIVTGIKNVVKAQFDTVKNIAKSLGSGLKSIFSSAWDTIKRMFSKGADGVIGFINLILKAINAIPGLPDIGLIDGGDSGPPADVEAATTPKQQHKGAVAHSRKAWGGMAWGGMVPGNGNGDTVPLHMNGQLVAMVEPGELVSVANKNATAALMDANSAVPRRSHGGMVPRLSIGDIAGGAWGGVKDVGSYVVGHSTTAKVYKAVKGVYDVLKLLPGLDSLPDWLGGMGSYALNAAKDYIGSKGKDAFAAVASAAGVGGGTSMGPDGIGSYKGVSMANWVIESLKYAASKGVSPQPTSGYRSHAYNVAQGRTYFSEHEGTKYPHGAVDFGGFTTGLAAKMSVVGATADFKYPLLAPIGFSDDGHASGTGHSAGGIVKMLRGGGKVPKPAWGARWVKPKNPSKWTVNEVATLISQAGGKANEARALSSKVMGESSGNPKAVGNDPGGSHGYGLLQITDHFNDALIAKYGGKRGMFNPINNVKAALEIYRSQGIGAWYAPTGRAGKIGKSLVPAAHASPATAGGTKTRAAKILAKLKPKTRKEAVAALVKKGIPKKKAQKLAAAYLAAQKAPPEADPPEAIDYSELLGLERDRNIALAGDLALSQNQYGAIPGVLQKFSSGQPWVGAFGSGVTLNSPTSAPAAAAGANTVVPMPANPATADQSVVINFHGDLAKHVKHQVKKNNRRQVKVTDKGIGRKARRMHNAPGRR